MVRLGERRPVPILDMEREHKAAAPGPVITYKLPPEEIERKNTGQEALMQAVKARIERAKRNESTCNLESHQSA